MLEPRIEYVEQQPLYQGNGPYNPKPQEQELYMVVNGEVYQLNPNSDEHKRKYNEDGTTKYDHSNDLSHKIGKWLQGNGDGE